MSHLGVPPSGKSTGLLWSEIDSLRNLCDIQRAEIERLSLALKEALINNANIVSHLKSLSNKEIQ